MTTTMETLTQFEGDQCCIFCRENIVDELKFGKIHKYEDVITHHFCMLFSAEIEQNGADTEGILGFLPQDIEKEKKRGDKIRCNYCLRDGATINCSVKRCKKKFHYSCGVEFGSLHQFFDHFKSFCVHHRKIQNVPYSLEKHICTMCYEEVNTKPSLNTIWAPCCNAWFHRSCVQKMALNGGYFFRCSKCNNDNIFRNEMLECGIYIPDQDASWELEPHAYEELGQRHNVCDAETCRCPKGRRHQSLGTWELLLCMFCGSQGTHYPCSKTAINELGKWTCPTCSSVTKQSAHLSSVASALPEPNVVREPRRPRPKKHCRPGRRKRIALNDESYASASKRRAVNALSSDDSDSEPTASSVFNVNSSRGVNPTTSWEDSDENESDVEPDRNAACLNSRPLIVVPNIVLQANSAVIDLGSDDEVLPSRTTRENISSENNEVTSTSIDDNIILDDDDDNEDDDECVSVSCDKNVYEASKKKSKRKRSRDSSQTGSPAKRRDRNNKHEQTCVATKASACPSRLTRATSRQPNVTAEPACSLMSAVSPAELVGHVAQVPRMIKSTRPTLVPIKKTARKDMSRPLKSLAKPGGGAFTKEVQLSRGLANLMGCERMRRQTVLERMYKIIKDRKLWDPNNGQFFECDEELEKLLGKKRIRGFGMMAYLNKHFIKKKE